MAQSGAIQVFKDKLTEISNMPSGTAFSVSFSDADVTKAAAEYLTNEEATVNAMIRQYLNVSISVSDPKVTFTNGKIEISIKAGKGFLKVSAGAVAAVSWENGQVVVHTESVNVPIVKVEPAQVDGYIQPLLNSLMAQVSQSCEIQSLSITDGMATINAIKK